MADEKNPARIKLKNVRLSHQHVFKPQKFDDASDGPAKYNTKAIMDPETKIGNINIGLIEDAIEHVIEEKWGKKRPKLKDDKFCMREGDERYDDPEYVDMFYISASNERKPLVLDRDGEELVESDDVIYSGCFVDLIVTVWAQDNKYGQRVNMSLEGVKFRDDGDSLQGGSKISASDFDDDDDDDDDRGSSRGSSRGRGRSRDEDEDEKPRGRGRGRSRDEDEDEKPRGRGRGRSRDEDEDEDEKPRGRGRARDEEEEEPRGRGRRSRDEEDEPKSSRRRRSTGRDDDIA